MWTALILALLSYLLSNPKNSEERKKALLQSAAIGAGTYAVTNYTDWGQANLQPINDSINTSLGFGETGTSKDGVTKSTSTAAPGTTNAPSGGFFDGVFDVLKSWGGVGTAAVVGTTAVTTTDTKKWLPWIVIGGVAYFVLKD